MKTKSVEEIQAIRDIYTTTELCSQMNYSQCRITIKFYGLDEVDFLYHG